MPSSKNPGSPPAPENATDDPDLASMSSSSRSAKAPRQRGPHPPLALAEISVLLMPCDKGQSPALDSSPGRSDGAAKTTDLTFTTAGPATTAPSGCAGTYPSEVPATHAIMYSDQAPPYLPAPQDHRAPALRPTAIPEGFFSEPPSGHQGVLPDPNQGPEYSILPQPDPRASRNAWPRAEARKRKWKRLPEGDIGSDTGHKRRVYLAECGTSREPADEASARDGEYGDEEAIAGSALPNFLDHLQGFDSQEAVAGSASPSFLDEFQGFDNDDFLRTKPDWRQSWIKEMHEARMKREYKLAQNSTCAPGKGSYTSSWLNPATPWSESPPSLRAAPANGKDEGPHCEHIEHSNWPPKTSEEVCAPDLGKTTERENDGKGKANECSAMVITNGFVDHGLRPLWPSAPQILAATDHGRSASFPGLSNPPPPPPAGRFAAPLRGPDSFSSAASSLDHIPRRASLETPPELLNQGLYDMPDASLPPDFDYEDEDTEPEDSEPEGKSKEQATKSPSAVPSSEEDILDYSPGISEVRRLFALYLAWRRKRLIEGRSIKRAHTAPQE